MRPPDTGITTATSVRPLGCMEGCDDHVGASRLLGTLNGIGGAVSAHGLSVPEVPSVEYGAHGNPL